MKARTLLAALLLSVWAFTAAASQTGEVNVYTSRKEELVKTLFDKFTADTGIQVNFITDDAEKLIARIKSEGKDSPADLFMTADIANLLKAKNEGLLSPVESKTLQKSIPAAFRDKDNEWFGLTKRARVIIYDKKKIKPGEINNYEDLSSPKWKGKILSRSSASSYNQSLLASIIMADGKEKAAAWAKGVAANFARKPQGGDTDQIKALLAGEGEIAIVNTYYLGRMIEAEKKSEGEIEADEEGEENEAEHRIGVIFPNQKNRGAHVNISGGGVVKTAKNRESAVKLLEFLAGNEAQSVYALANHEYPITPGVKPSSIVASWGSFKEDATELWKFDKHVPEAVKLFDEAGWR